MHGREGENRKRSRHMWSVPTPVLTARRIVNGDSAASTTDSFSKDGRKISVGDCALFKPPQDSPPFIGIIRWLSLNKENNLQLGVNWLYRPGEVKLGKGILLDAVPNEVFYSFHKDEIPAASLLHPCKVAFLPKGVKLPSGISSFVCHRVYDVANKCLWWLTDKNYIDRREEVNQLLYKTHIEMHATVQPGARSPKPINVPTSTSQLKPGSDIQTSTSFPSNGKGKKRELSDQGLEPAKRECSSKMEDGDPDQFKPESVMKLEISKITEKGSLVDCVGVGKLVQLMQLDRAEKMELINRSMLAAVIAATDKFDCLSEFVHLKGLSVLDEWLQDVHKVKIGDGSPKDGDKSVEEFLFILLCALDKLPVNLQALQMCNIGKSVNHLRTHKNLEIQKKARGLVDTWKKGVEAEMNGIDAMSASPQAVSWSSRSRLPEVSQGGNRQASGSSEVTAKSSVTLLSASKTPPIKLVQGEFSAKSPSSSGPLKIALSPAAGKDGMSTAAVASTSDIPSASLREVRSSTSSQSFNNSQSCSNDNSKTMVLAGKEDVRSSTAGSTNISKMAGGSSRHRRSINGFPGPVVSGGHRETGSSRSSLHRSTAAEKEMPSVEGNNHKLIVKIPNGGRSPGQSASGGSIDDPSIMNSRASSPLRHDQSDRNLKEKIDPNRSNVSDVNAESWQSNDFKDVLTGSDEGDGSPAAIPEAEQCRTDNDVAKLLEISKAASSLSGNEIVLGKLHELSFGTLNSLIESFKYSEASASASVGDDVGMNLLASVAAGEISAKSDLVSPQDSPQRSTLPIEDSSLGDDAKLKTSNENNLSKEPSEAIDDAIADSERPSVGMNGSLWSRDGLQHPAEHVSSDSSGVGNATSSKLEQTPRGVGSEDLRQDTEPCPEIPEKSDDVMGAIPVAASLVSHPGRKLNGEESKYVGKVSTITSGSADAIHDGRPNRSSSSFAGVKVGILSSVDVLKENVEGSSTVMSLENEENKGFVNGGLHVGSHTEQKLPAGIMHHECVAKSEHKDLPLNSPAEMNGGRVDETDERDRIIQSGKQKIDYGNGGAAANESQMSAILPSFASELKADSQDTTIENKESVGRCFGGTIPQKESAAVSAQKIEQIVKPGGSKITGVKAYKIEDCASTISDSSFAATKAVETSTKLKFDLNEGFIGDDAKHVEPINLSTPGTSVHSVNSLPFSVSPISCSLPASITVAAAAKGPFVYPDDLLKSKGEPGWKGSAATSAFRPAEPRKVLELPLSTTSVPLADGCAGKHGRPILDIDLNVPDERILEDIASQNPAQEMASTSDQTNNRDLARSDLMGSVSARSSGGLDLDLNQVDEAGDMGQYPAISTHRPEVPLLPAKSSSAVGFLNCDVRRDFDLNDGPVIDETSAEPSSFNQHGRSSMLTQPLIAGLRMANADTGNFSSWFSSGNTYPAVTIHSILPERGEQPFPIIATGTPPRVLTSPTGGTPFMPDVYRGAVLSSSPAVPYPSTPFQNPIFPFGSSFPLPSASFSGGSTAYLDSASGSRICFPPVNPQLLGSAATVSSQYPRPYVVSLPDVGNSIAVDNRKWGRQGLDLNSGPGAVEIEGRDQASSLTSRQLSVTSSEVLAEEQGRMYQQMAGNVLKRKDPEGGWDNESFRYKQASWQ